MAARVRIFIDFWNFQLTWNNTFSSESRIDWSALPSVFARQAEYKLAEGGAPRELQLEEVRVYASYDAQTQTGTKLQNWLKNWLDRQPGYRVYSKPRMRIKRKIYCRECEYETETCPECGMPLRGTTEKGVDTSVATGLLSMALDDSSSIAILTTSDSDLIPAVELAQSIGLKVVNACWKTRGHDLAASCWASFNIEDTQTEITITEAGKGN